MLFDLRGRGRRRTVQVIYLTLAVVMGGGLVLFGVGGNVQGGLLDAFKNDSQGSGADKQIEQRITRAEAAARRAPRDAQLRAQLARLHYQAAAVSGFSQTTGSFTPKARPQLRAAAQSWRQYLALDPKQPDPSVATLMVQVYGAGGLNQLDRAVRAQEIVTERREPNSNLFAQLAVLAYQAGQQRKGDLAADRAVKLADKADRKLLRDQLASAKTQVSAQQSAPQQGSATTPSG